MKLTIAFCLLLVHSASAWAIIPSGKACDSTFLRDTLADDLDGELQGEIGSVKGLTSLLLKAGAQFDDAHFVSTLIDGILDEPRKSGIHNIANHIDAADSEQNQLVLCLLTNGCGLTNGRTLIYGVVDPTHAHSGEGLAVALGQPRSPLVHLIVTSPIDFAVRNKIRYAGEILAALGRYADFLLVEEWVRANDILILAGRKPDTHFARHVAYGIRSVEVDMGFYDIFQEIRAYSILLVLIDEVHGRDSKFYRNENKRFRTRAMALVAKIRQGGGYSGVNYNNVLERFDDIAGNMEKTIADAISLSSSSSPPP